MAAASRLVTAPAVGRGYGSPYAWRQHNLPILDGNVLT
jgi:hypothetical protein